MTIWNHIKSQPFVAATAAAALVHSSWSLGTLFSGVQPIPPEIGVALQLWIEFAIKTLAWHIPAVAIAFAFDVGQVVTAHEIRTAHSAGRKPWRKYITFVVFAAATYYLQMLYAAHHFPELALGAGVSADHRATVQMWLDAAVWVIPMFLPLSTLLYTFSGDDGAHVETPAKTPATPHIRVSTPQRPAAPVLDALPPHIEALVNELATAPALAELPATVEPVAATPSWLEAVVTELQSTPMNSAIIETPDDLPVAEWTPLLPDEPVTTEDDTAQTPAVEELYADREPLPITDPMTGVKAVKAKPPKPVTPPQATLF